MYWWRAALLQVAVWLAGRSGCTVQLPPQMCIMLQQSTDLLRPFLVPSPGVGMRARAGYIYIRGEFVNERKAVMRAIGAGAGGPVVAGL